MTTPADPTLLYGGNAPFIEALYEDYLQDPTSVDATWRGYFERLKAGGNGREPIHSAIQRAFAEQAAAGRSTRVPAAGMAGATVTYGSSALINAYRAMGHLQANLDPLKQRPVSQIPELDPSYYGLTPADLAAQVTDGAFSGTLAEVLAAVKETYCSAIGFEYAYLPRIEREWLQGRIEANRGRGAFDAETQKRILEKITAAEGMEKYLHARYVGQKRFSLEGGDTTIPMLDACIRKGGTMGVKEVVIGMAHRGRLNVLVNVFGKKTSDLFAEFEGKKSAAHASAGDVKYHLGFSSDFGTAGGNVHMALAFNPSHLELVDPVVEGSVRARQDRLGEAGRDQVLPILLHGDAALPGQGVVAETLNLSQLRGFATGGTLHVVINNQVGFTISEPTDARSSRYNTDIAKFVDAPVFHVNGDDPEAAVFAMHLALEYRMAFHKDVFVDLVCFRRHGHNESDEPRVTQPGMYRSVDQHPGARSLYADKLTREGVVPEGEAKQMVDRYRDRLDAGEVVTEARESDSKATTRALHWAPFFGTPWTSPAETGLPLDELKRLGEGLTAFPEGFVLHPRVEAIVKSRRAMAKGDMPLDWGFAENLAYAGLVTHGFPVRITGQDAGRATFFHRHAVFHNQDPQADAASRRYLPLQHLSPEQARFQVFDSTLSEEAVLGFEYGYASAEPNSLVIWEAQYGDFANGAQAVIDQFISAGEVKWGRLSGLVMFLPHGFEGQGPEHSSARLERYLQLCAEDNMQVVVPSSPAQMFHMIRRQILRPYRKPLIVMTPKSLLRHKLSVSSLGELAAGQFQPVIGDPEVGNAERVVVSSGKLYYELLEARQKQALKGVALVRLEQLYPFPAELLRAELAKHPRAQVVWAQEEPENMGGWYFVQGDIRRCLTPEQALMHAARPRAASPATGYAARHVEQQQTLINQALGVDPAVKEPALRDTQFTG